MMIAELSAGDRVHRYHKSVVIEFHGNRKVLSTSVINGCYRTDLTAVFNHDGTEGPGIAYKLKAPTYEEHMRIIAAELGLDPERTAGIGTAASMDNVSVQVRSFGKLTVTALVTGGVEVNGGRVGDPALPGKNEKGVIETHPGTINIMLMMDADLPANVLTRALVTCTEAKTAALQELMAGSRYSRGLATGSGTDGTILICNSDSPLKLTDAGKHSKLGELIGVSVKAAVKEALFLQTGLCPEYQHSLLHRFQRFGLDEDMLWKECQTISAPPELNKSDFIDRLHRLDAKSGLLVPASLFIHLMDQADWGLLSCEEAASQGKLLLEGIGEAHGAGFRWREFEPCAVDDTISGMLNNMAALWVSVCLAAQPSQSREAAAEHTVSEA